MPTKRDDEVTYLRGLGFTGTIADMRREYLKVRCSINGVTPIYTPFDTNADMAWRNGIDLEEFIGPHASSPTKNLFTYDKGFVGVTGWTTAGTGASASTITSVVDGTAPVTTAKVLNLQANADAPGVPGATVRQTVVARIPVVAGKLYTISSYAKWVTGTLKTVHMNVIWYNAAGTTAGNDISQSKVIDSATWTRIANNDNLAPSNAVALDVRYTIDSPVNLDEVRFCGILVEEGNWSESDMAPYA
jgi:hypothetical protein